MSDRQVGRRPPKLWAGRPPSFIREKEVQRIIAVLLSPRTRQKEKRTGLAHPLGAYIFSSAKTLESEYS
jgi:hypothetical protein